MKRRTFLLSTAAFAGVTGAKAFAGIGVDYSADLLNAELSAGKTVFLDFSAPWCSTCRAQEKVINALFAENPAYEDEISFILVDWDTHRNSNLAKKLNVTRQSTLIVLKGQDELGRIIAGTGRDQIKGLLDTALGAATA